MLTIKHEVISIYVIEVFSGQNTFQGAIAMSLSDETIRTLNFSCKAAHPCLAGWLGVGGVMRKS